MNSSPSQNTDNTEIGSEKIDVTANDSKGVFARIKSLMKPAIMLAVLAGLADNADAQTRGTKSSKPTPDAKEEAGKAGTVSSAENPPETIQGEAWVRGLFQKIGASASSSTNANSTPESSIEPNTSPSTNSNNASDAINNKEEAWINPFLRRKPEASPSTNSNNASDNSREKGDTSVNPSSGRSLEAKTVSSTNANDGSDISKIDSSDHANVQKMIEALKAKGLLVPTENEPVTKAEKGIQVPNLFPSSLELIPVDTFMYVTATNKSRIGVPCARHIGSQVCVGCETTVHKIRRNVDDSIVVLEELEHDSKIEYSDNPNTLDKDGGYRDPYAVVTNIDTIVNDKSNGERGKIPRAEEKTSPSTSIVVRLRSWVVRPKCVPRDSNEVMQRIEPYKNRILQSFNAGKQIRYNEAMNTFSNNINYSLVGGDCGIRAGFAANKLPRVNKKMDSENNDFFVEMVQGHIDDERIPKTRHAWCVVKIPPSASHPNGFIVYFDVDRNEITGEQFNGIISSMGHTTTLPMLRRKNHEGGNNGGFTLYTERSGDHAAYMCFPGKGQTGVELQELKENPPIEITEFANYLKGEILEQYSENERFTLQRN